MELEQIFIPWLNSGLEPGGIALLPPRDLCEFCADIYENYDKDLAGEALAEGLVSEQALSALLDFYRRQDWMRLGELVDSLLTSYIADRNHDYYDSILQIAWEQSTPYTGE